MGGYSTLHVLRAFARHVDLYGAPPQQPPEYGSRPDDLARVYEGSATTSFPHLIEFSDSEGWYVPLDFERPVTVVLEDGTWHVGSCVRLLAELDRLEPHLSHAPDLALVREDTVRNALAHEPFAHVVWPWAVLRWLAREAVARNAILRFG